LVCSLQRKAEAVKVVARVEVADYTLVDGLRAGNGLLKFLKRAEQAEHPGQR
jgi:hypothetical protein